jgi:hypothetical protein
VDVERFIQWCVAFAGMVALEIASNGGAAQPRFEAIVELARSA